MFNYLEENKNSKLYLKVKLNNFDKGAMFGLSLEHLKQINEPENGSKENKEKLLSERILIIIS